MSHPLRPYQAEAITALKQSLGAGNRRVLLQLATGAGKTRIAAEICRMAATKRSRVLFLAPRRELIQQAQKAFQREGLFAGIIMAGERPSRSLDLQVASFDTLHARAIRRKVMAMPPADVVIVDEAHLSIAESRKTIIEHYGNAVVIGLTATPARGDGRGLGELYDAMVNGPTITQLVDDGHLVPLRYFAPSAPDLAKLRLNRDGDYVEAGLAERMDEPHLIGDIVTNWFNLARHRSTVVFCVNCAHSRHVRDAFLAAGISAEHVDGETDLIERAEIFERVRTGETQVLCNVFVASYGLDIPSLDCAVLARPTKNIALYLQTIGRVMRPAERKVDALIIDHAGAIRENGFADDYIPWSLDAATKVKDRKASQQQERNAPKDIECRQCHHVFKARRDCPNCGFQMLAPTKDIPVFEADLHEIQRAAAKSNREATWPEKQQFIAGLRAFAREHGYQEGWIAHKYRVRFGVWPNDERVKRQPAQPYSDELRKWIVSQNIRHAKRRAVA